MPVTPLREISFSNLFILHESYRTATTALAYAPFDDEGGKEARSQIWASLEYLHARQREIIDVAKARTPPNEFEASYRARLLMRDAEENSDLKLMMRYLVDGLSFTESEAA